MLVRVLVLVAMALGLEGVKLTDDNSQVEGGQKQAKVERVSYRRQYSAVNESHSA